MEIYKTFIQEFRTTKGGWQIIVIGFLVAVGVGSVIGVIPQITTQRYAEELYGYDGAAMMPPCNSFHNNKNNHLLHHRTNNEADDDNNNEDLSTTHIPQACGLGSDHAQNSASITTLTRNLLALLFNGIAGSYSDQHGRRS